MPSGLKHRNRGADDIATTPSSARSTVESFARMSNPALSKVSSRQQYGPPGRRKPYTGGIGLRTAARWLRLARSPRLRESSSFAHHALCRPRQGAIDIRKDESEIALIL